MERNLQHGLELVILIQRVVCRKWSPSSELPSAEAGCCVKVMGYDHTSPQPQPTAGYARDRLEDRIPLFTSNATTWKVMTAPNFSVAFAGNALVTASKSNFSFCSVLLPSFLVYMFFQAGLPRKASLCISWSKLSGAWLKTFCLVKKEEAERMYKVEAGKDEDLSKMNGVDTMVTQGDNMEKWRMTRRFY